jgi:processive 1,2-diacylglycerol beta-glucosyltransferase
MRGTLGGIADVCRSLAGLAIPFSALVVTGHDARLAADLAARVGDDRRFRIFGPVADMASLMGAADLVVTKAGASTCAEALALGRPLVFYRSLPGQERANEAALVRAGVGVRAGDRASLAACLAAVLAEDGPRDRLAAAARRARRAEAARVVAKEMLALLSG